MSCELSSRSDATGDHIDDLLDLTFSNDENLAIGKHSYNLVLSWGTRYLPTTIPVILEVQHPCRLETNHVFVGTCEPGTRQAVTVRVISSPPDLLSEARAVTGRSDIKGVLDLEGNFGQLDPKAAGIQYTLTPLMIVDRGVSGWVGSEKLEPGWDAVSVSLLRGREWCVFNGKGSRSVTIYPNLSYYLRLKPIAMAGYSIYIYHVTEGDATRLPQEPGVSDHQHHMRGWARDSGWAYTDHHCNSTARNPPFDNDE